MDIAASLAKYGRIRRVTSTITVTQESMRFLERSSHVAGSLILTSLYNFGKGRYFVVIIDIWTFGINFVTCAIKTGVDSVLFINLKLFGVV